VALIIAPPPIVGMRFNPQFNEGQLEAPLIYISALIISLLFGTWFGIELGFLRGRSGTIDSAPTPLEVSTVPQV
jgi:hypothetical protein